MDLATAGNHPFDITIDGQKYVVERLTVADLAGISQTIKDERRETKAAEYDKKIEGVEDPKQLGDLEREKLNAIGGVEAPGPSELMGWLLADFQGMAMALNVALHKKQPDLAYSVVNNLQFGDEFVQAVYDVLGVRLKVAKSPVKSKRKKKRPFPKRQTAKKGTG